MTKVGIAELKARLSEFVRRARRGETLIVCDRDEPVAQMGPVATDRTRLVIRKPRGRFRRPCDVPLPLGPLALSFDPVEELVADRERERGR